MPFAFIERERQKMMIRQLAAIAVIAILAMACGTSQAAIYGTANGLTLSGSRSEATAGQMVLGGNWLADGITPAGDIQSVAWLITDMGTHWHYQYTFTNFGSPDISHAILDLTDDAVTPNIDPFAVYNIDTNSGDDVKVELTTFGPHPSNPGFPAGNSIIGIKFDFGGESPFIIEFDSNRSPVWGDFYVKGGNDSLAYNDGLTKHASSDDVSDFIARPNGIIEPAELTPEPATLATWLAGMALSTVVVSRRRKSA